MSTNTCISWLLSWNIDKEYFVLESIIRVCTKYDQVRPRAGVNELDLAKIKELESINNLKFLTTNNETIEHRKTIPF